MCESEGRGGRRAVRGNVTTGLGPRHPRSVSSWAIAPSRYHRAEKAKHVSGNQCIPDPRPLCPRGGTQENNVPREARLGWPCAPIPGSVPIRSCRAVLRCFRGCALAVPVRTKQASTPKDGESSKSSSAFLTPLACERCLRNSALPLDSVYHHTCCVTPNSPHLDFPWWGCDRTLSSSPSHRILFDLRHGPDHPAAAAGLFSSWRL